MITRQAVSSAVIPRVVTIGGLHATQAEPYPERPIKIIVPTPGRRPGRRDRAPRRQLSLREARSGCGDRQPAGRRQYHRSKEAAQAEPDGYTLLYSSASGFVLTRSSTRSTPQINTGVKSPDVIAALAKLSNEPLGGTPQAFTALIKADIATWTPIVKALGLTAQ